MENYLYVVRNKYGTLWMHTEKPEKMDDMWFSGMTTCVMLDKNMFPNVKWEDDEPTLVVLQQALFKSKENGNN